MFDIVENETDIQFVDKIKDPTLLKSNPKFKYWVDEYLKFPNPDMMSNRWLQLKCNLIAYVYNVNV